MNPMQRPRDTSIRRSSLVAVALVGSGLFPWVTGVSAASAATTHKAKSVVISTSQNSLLGTILVSGTALYTVKSSRTPCTAQCIKIWPELLLPKGVTKAKAGFGVNAAKLGTVKRAHGALQVTYAGKPLYWFSEDTAGQVNGNISDVWGKWSVIVTAKLANASPLTGSPAPAVAPTSPDAGTSPPTNSGSHPTSPTPTSPSAPNSPSPTTPPPSPPTTPPTSPPPTSPPPTSPPPTNPGGGGVGF